MANTGKTVTVRACASLNGTDNRYAASWVKAPDGVFHRTGQDVERIFGSNNSEGPHDNTTSQLCDGRVRGS